MSALSTKLSRSIFVRNVSSSLSLLDSPPRYPKIYRNLRYNYLYVKPSSISVYDRDLKMLNQEKQNSERDLPFSKHSSDGSENIYIKKKKKGSEWRRTTIY